MTRGEMRKAQIMAFLADFRREHDYPPSVRDICKGTGLKSTSSVYFYLRDLKIEGKVVFSDNKRRTLVSNERKTIHMGDSSVMCSTDAVNMHYGAKFVTKMNDSGMVDASILPSDTLTVRRQNDAKVGEIVVALHDDHFLIRRLGIVNNSLYLVPDNDDYICVRMKDATILGKVISMQRDL